MTQLRFNPLMMVDSYKLSHSPLYPKIEGMSSYITARTNGLDVMVPFGIQLFVKKFMLTKLEQWMVDELEEFAKLHGEPFDRVPFDYIVDTYGYFPVTIRSVKEGLPIASGKVLVRIECTDPTVAWIVSYLETAMLRVVWYATTIATNDRYNKQDLARWYLRTGADLAGLAFALHDFGGRGVSSGETAEIGGAAHLVNFMGSDTVEGIRAANFYYNDKMAGFSVPATEHSIECSWGGTDLEEDAYLSHVLTTYAKPGAIVSIVIDGYDVYRAAAKLCTKFKEQIIASGAKVVFRPDSGDMLEVVPRILKMQADAFGYKFTSTGHAKINYVGLLQGDGVDRDSMNKLLHNLEVLGYSADNVVFGSGGALLQKVNRDTYKFAQKASAILVDGVWKPIAKNPITDKGKKSLAGRYEAYKSLITGEVMDINIDTGTISNEFSCLMHTVYQNGKLYNETTLANVRELAAL